MNKQRRNNGKGIDQEPLIAALERAIRYRRQLAIDAGAPAGNLDERITGELYAVPATRGVRPGWLIIGCVSDDIAGASLEVHWQPATDRVQIERPPDDTVPLRPTPQLVPVPLVYEQGMGRWTTWHTFVYLYDGQEYDAATAQRLINQQGNAQGWTWRPIRGEERG